MTRLSPGTNSPACQFRGGLTRSSLTASKTADLWLSPRERTFKGVEKAPFSGLDTGSGAGVICHGPGGVSISIDLSDVLIGGFG